MAYSLNTAHPLYANLVELIGVDAGALVSLKTARTFTAAAGSNFGSGIYGQHFSSVGGGFTPSGATFTPSLPLPPDRSIFFVLNAVTNVGGGGNMTLLDAQDPRPTIGLSTGSVAAAWAVTGIGAVGTTDLSTGAHILALTRTGETAHALYVDAAAAVAGAQLGFNSSLGYTNIGGVQSQHSVSASFVWIAAFDKVLTATEISDLRASVAAGNVIGLVSAASTPVAFTGTVPAQNATIGAASSLALASYFSGSLTPFVYSVFSGVLPAGLALNTSTGVISGTPTTAGTANIVVRATDTAANTANTNSFSITVSATSTPVSFSGTVPAQSRTVGVASSVSLASFFSGSLTPFTYSVFSGVLPAGLALNTSTGVISGTPSAAGTASIVIRATDTGANTASTNSFSITVAAAPTSGVTVTEPLKNNTGTVLASQTGIRVSVLKAADLVGVYAYTGTVTNPSGVMPTISDAAIIPGTAYHVVIKLADGSVGVTQSITAT